MPLRFIKKNILSVPADIIVNPSDGRTLNETKISQSIISAAGKEYEDMVSKIPPFSVGNAILTGNLIVF